MTEATVRDWRQCIMPDSASLHDVISVLERTGVGIVLIQNKLGKLVGTVTDGDIRRYLMQGKSLDAGVANVMCHSPTTADDSTSRESCKQILVSKNLRHLPLADIENRPAGLIRLEGFLKAENKQELVFIMAGGLGSRLKPLTDDCPKPMLRVAGKPILERVISSMSLQGFKKFAISVHYLPRLIQDYFGDGTDFGVEITYVYENQPLGTGGALALLPLELRKNNTIVINGDLLTNLDFNNLLSFHISEQAFATVCARGFDYTIPYGVINKAGSKLLSIVEKPVESSLVNAGIYVISPDFFDHVPYGTASDMPDLISDCAVDYKVCVFPLFEYWIDVGRPDEFSRANDDFQSKR